MIWVGKENNWEKNDLSDDIFTSVSDELIETSTIAFAVFLRRNVWRATIVDWNIDSMKKEETLKNNRPPQNRSFKNYKFNVSERREYGGELI